MKAYLKTLVLIAVVTLSALPVKADEANFEYEYEGHTLKYYIVFHQEYGSINGGWYVAGVDDGNMVSGDVTIPATVPYEGKEYEVCCIRDFAFQNYEGLTSVKIPNSASIGNYAFDGCVNLTSINIPTGETYIADCAFRGCISLPSIEIPASVRYIDPYAFEKCTNLSELKLHDGLKFVYGSAFIDCSSLKEIDLPSTIEQIGKSAFRRCTSLTAVKMHEGFDALIGDYAFADCGSLAEIDFPNTLGWISESAFSNCVSLESVKLPVYLHRLEERAFHGCKALRSIDFTGTVQLKCIMDETFAECTGMTDALLLSPSLTEIGEKAFYGCESLTKLELGCNIAHIGNKAFSGCNALKDIYSYNTEVPYLSPGAFTDYSATLHLVPGSKEAYMNDPNWSKFRNMTEDLTGIDEVEADASADEPAEIFNLHGVKVGTTADGLAPGVYIKRQGGKTTKIMVN